MRDKDATRQRRREGRDTERQKHRVIEEEGHWPQGELNRTHEIKTMSMITRKACKN